MPRFSFNFPDDISLSTISSSRRKSSASLRLATYNLQSGRNNRLEQAIRSICLMNIDIAIFTETKLTNNLHTHYFLDYHVIATSAPSASQGGVALVYRDSSSWHLESPCVHGPNAISAVLVSGTRRWTLLGSYISPNEHDGSTLAHVVQVASRHSHPIIWTGDFNAALDSPPDARDTAIAATVSSLGVSDLSTAFFRRRSVFRWTWRQRRSTNTVSSLCDYILCERRPDFRNLRYLTPRTFDNDHRLLCSDLLLSSPSSHRQYVSSHSKFPFRSPTHRSSPCDRILSTLRRFCQPPTRHRFRARSWISAETWTHIDRRAQGRRLGSLSSTDLLSLNKLIRKCLRRDRRNRIQKVSVEIEDGCETI
jgi:exonuclease III